MKTSNYYIQQLYSLNSDGNVIPATMDGKPVAGKDGQSRLYATALRDGDEIIVKMANLSEFSQTVTIEFAGAEYVSGINVTTVHSDNPMAENTVEAPDTIVPVTSEITLKKLPSDNGSSTVSTKIGGRTFAVYKFRTRIF